MRKKPSEYNGIVVIDKPAGITSHDVVDRLRRIFKTRRVGHTGTLDPDATGVLVLCLGYATRLAEYLSSARKHYVASVVFGVETDTQDASGVVLRESDARTLAQSDVERLLPRFRGKIEQVPPMVSALHHEGRRLYELAREGATVDRAAREIEIFELAMVDWSPGEHPVAELTITCSTGTYIRTLAYDIGRAAGSGAMMGALRRTWVGSDEESGFTLEQALDLPSLERLAERDALQTAVISLDRALRDWPTVRLNESGTAAIRQGRAIDIEQAMRECVQAALVRPIAALDPDGELFAICAVVEERLQPVKVLT